MSPNEFPTRFFLTGFFGAGNIGDEAVCLAVAKGIKQAIPDAEFSIVTRDPAYSTRFTGLKQATLLKGFYPASDFWRRSRQYFKALKKSDVVVIGGGGILQDVHSWTTIPTHLLAACLGIIWNKKVVTVGIGVGPVNRSWLKRLIVFTCNHMHSVQVRDEESRSELIKYGVIGAKIRVTADVVPSLDLKKMLSSGFKKPKQKVVAFAFRRWKDMSEKALADTCARLLENNVKVQLLCYETRSDKLFYEDVVRMIRPDLRAGISIEVPERLEDSIDAVSNADFIVTMRLHGCVFAASLGINFLAVPYDPKVSEFVRRIGESGRIVSFNQLGSSLGDRVLKMMNEAGSVPSWKEKFQTQQQLSASNFSSIIDLKESKDTANALTKAAARKWLTTLMIRGMHEQMIRPFKSVNIKVRRLIARRQPAHSYKLKETV